MPRYYYHSKTHETRWEPPSGGFLSIKEQRELRGDEDKEGVQAGSDEDEDDEERKEKEEQALLAAHQAKKKQADKSEADRLPK